MMNNDEPWGIYDDFRRLYGFIMIYRQFTYKNAILFRYGTFNQETNHLWRFMLTFITAHETTTFVHWDDP